MAKNIADKILEQIRKLAIEQIMSDRFGRYSKYIIQGRALPDVRDGLKPVQRRILFAMYELNLLSHLPFKKSARVVGEVIGKYHPHGDSSIYEALVRMAQDWKMLMPLIDMHGNKGSIDDDPAAAMRYTEVKLTKLAELMLGNLKKNTVKFIPNFDDSEREPIILPSLFPNLLVNGSRGIAAGYATEMPPHNLGEIVDAIIYKIRNPQAKLDAFLKIVKGPDFPTGAIVQGVEGIYKAFETGQGRISIVAKYTISQENQLQTIMIHEIPYGIVKQKLVKDLDEIRFNEKIAGIKEVRDDSDRNGVAITIELENNANAKLIINYLLQKTDLQCYYNYNNIAIVDNAPQQVGLIKIIDAYLQFQNEIQKKALQFDLSRDLLRLEIVQGFIKVANNVDAVIKVIQRAEGSKVGVVKALIENFQFSEVQANAIAELRLYRLSQTDQHVFQTELENLQVNIEYLQSILNSEARFNDYLIDLLKKLKQDFALPRKTIIEAEVQKISINMSELIKHEDVYLGVTTDGYIKRLSLRTYDNNDLLTYALKEEDRLCFLSRVNTSDKLLIFTNLGNYILLLIHEINESKWKEFGQHINDFAILGPSEKIVSVWAINFFSPHLVLIFVSQHGQIKRSGLSEFETTRINKSILAFKIGDQDEVIKVLLSNSHQEIMLLTNGNRVAYFDEREVPVYGLKSSGVRALILEKGEQIQHVLVNKCQGQHVVLISQRGAMKALKCASINKTRRPGTPRMIFHQVKTVPHHVLYFDILNNNSDQIIIANDNHTLNKIDLKHVALSLPTEGFGHSNLKEIKWVVNLTSSRITKENHLLLNLEVNDFDIKFDELKARVDQTKQISLDEIIEEANKPKK